MAEYLQCGVCFEPYTADSRLPKFLQCGGGIQHTYCLQCLRRLTIGGMIKCPSCGDLTSVGGLSADSLKNNIYLMPQIEAAAAAAQNRIGLEMFCKTCTAVAVEGCGEHDLLKMSELRDALRKMAEKGAATMEQVKEKRAKTMELFQKAHDVLLSVTESVQHTIDAYEMDVQLDDNVVSELERKREAAESLPSDQLVDSYRFTEQRVADAAAALRDTGALAERCRALLGTSVALAADGNGLRQEFKVGEWLHSGDLMKALLAASMVVYSLDHASSDGIAEAGASELTLDACCKASEAAQAVAMFKHANASDAKSCQMATNGDNNISHSKSSSKSTPSCNGKATSNSALSAPVNKTPATVTNGKSSAASSAINGAGPGNQSDPGKSNKIGSSSDKQTQSAATGKVSPVPATSTTKTSPTAAKSTVTATSTAAAVAKPKAAPSFSTMLKSSTPARAAAAAVDSAGQATMGVGRPGYAVQRPLRGVYPLYSLRVTNGTATADVVIELRTDMAPIMCKNFTLLCEGGHFDNSKFHFAVASDYLLGGLVDGEEGFSPLAEKGEKFVMADQCPLQDECGAIRMKGMGTVIDKDGRKRGLIGSQFMMWVSETREYRSYQYTLVFGFIRQGLDFIRAVSSMERSAISRRVRLLSTKSYQQ